MKLKTLVPAPVRLIYRLAQRKWSDYRGNFGQKFARPHSNNAVVFPYCYTLEQPILPSAFFENKMRNMQLAGKSIQKVVVLPGEIFSFWQIVGYPSPLYGYEKGRNLINGQLKSAYGGGLCQVSGIVYYHALCAAFEVLERHHHSRDIYAEQERFAPLGADATVVFGYKDMRFRNNSKATIRFDISVQNARITAILWSTAPIEQYTPHFTRTDAEQQRQVETWVNDVRVAESTYQVG